MKKIGIVSCDNWIGKIKEDINLCNMLKLMGVDAKIISWQQPLTEDFDSLILRSVWGYQDDYLNFKNWLLDIKKRGINLFNNPDIILTNILKDKQFEILQKNSIPCIKTQYLDSLGFCYDNLKQIVETSFNSYTTVIKPTISGSGNNTFVINPTKEYIDLPNIITVSEATEIFESLLNENLECKVMLQPYMPEINFGEYSCIFIDGILTHTMMRFPNVFHGKKRTCLVSDVPLEILNLAQTIEKITSFQGYLYMRVDMILLNGNAKIMEVELAEPDLLTKYIEDKNKQIDVIKILARRLERRTIKK